MSRKRKSTTQESTNDTSSPTSEPSDATPGVEPATNASQTGFAAQVGQRTGIPIPDPFSIAGDYLAGVRLFESKRDRQIAIKFGEGRPEDKPSQEVIGKLKETGYRWNPADRIWAHPLEPASAMTTRIDGEKLFQDICQMIRKEKGIATEQHIPF